jgi:hypothetical protein
MHTQYPTIPGPESPEYVLATMIDQHRQMCQLGDLINPDINLSFETTIEELREACELLPWRQLGRALNREWHLDLSDAEWEAVLEPASERTLGFLCRFIAQHVGVPLIRPTRLFGEQCDAGGAFLTIRSMLADAGADAAQIGPSTPLDEYARRYVPVFLGPISRLAPGALPPIVWHHPVYNWAHRAHLFSIVFLLLACIASVFWPDAQDLAWLAGMCFAISLLAGWFTARKMLPSRVTFGDLKTFRDLARVIAAGARFNRDAVH